MIKCLALNQLKMIPKNVKNHSNCASGITSQDEHKLKLATLEFSDYAMKWWHGIVKDIIYHKGPPVDSWNSLKDHMRARFVPPHFRKDLMLRLQRS